MAYNKSVFSTPNWEINPTGEQVFKGLFKKVHNRGTGDNEHIIKNCKRQLNRKRCNLSTGTLLENGDFAKKKRKRRKKSEQNGTTAKLHNSCPSKLKVKNKKRKKAKYEAKQEIPINEKHSVQDFVETKLVKNDTTVNNQEANTNTKKNLSLRERMMVKLKSAHFRYLNEQIYTLKGKDAKQFFEKDQDAYKAYHVGYRQQVSKWPINPIDIVIQKIKKLSPKLIIADLGCGEAKLSKNVLQTVHSFDLVAENELVTACDMAHIPLEPASVDIVVFCLSLMGTNLNDYIIEANRILKLGGTMKVAEVESRFENVDAFIKSLKSFGFTLTWKNFSHNLFYFMDFKKMAQSKKGKGLPQLVLKPCLYKKR